MRLSGKLREPCWTERDVKLAFFLLLRRRYHSLRTHQIPTLAYRREPRSNIASEGLWESAMSGLPQQPIIYEINTWVWLSELGRRHRREFTLATVPANEWDAVADHGAEAVWLMGVWERSPAGRKISLEIPALLAEYRRNLPDFDPEDVSGSPYSIRDYRVDAH